MTYIIAAVYDSCLLTKKKQSQTGNRLTVQSVCAYKQTNDNKNNRHSSNVVILQPLDFYWSIPSVPVSCHGGVMAGPCTQGPRLLAQHVADRLSSWFHFTTACSSASARTLNASKTGGRVQQTKAQPQLTERTAGLQPERSLILCVCCCEHTKHKDEE